MLIRITLVIIFITLQSVQAINANRDVTDSSIHILYINDRPEVWPWTLDMFNACTGELHALTGQNVLVDYLNLNIIPADSVYSEMALKLIQRKYENSIDLIIARKSIPNLCKLHEALPEVAIIIGSEMHATRDTLCNKYTRIIDIDISNTLEAILTCLPRTKQIHIVAGSEKLDKKLTLEIRQQYAEEYKKTRINYLIGLDLDTLLLRVSQLPRNDAILFLSYTKDSKGNYYTSKETVGLLHTAASVPIFGIASTYMNNGIVGGYLHSADADGKRTGRLAYSVLQGEAVDKIIVDKNSGEYIFDWNKLRKWRIKERNLPANSTILNKPSNILAKYPRLLPILALCFAAMWVIIIFLIVLQNSQRKTLIKLNETKELLNLALEHSHTSMFEANFNNRFVFTTKKMFIDLGYRPKDIPKTIDAYKQIIHPDDIDKIDNIFKNWKNKKAQEFNIEYRIQSKTGAWYWINSRGLIEGDSHKRGIKKIIGVSQIIQEQKDILEQVHKERDFNKQLVNLSPAFILYLSQSGKVVTMNHSMLNALGYEHEEVIGLDFITTFVPTPDSLALQEIIDRHIHTEEVAVFENHMIARDGKQILVEWHGKPARNLSNNQDGFFCIGIDITEIKNHQKQILKSIREQEIILSNDPAFIIFKDTENNIIKITDTVAKMTGLPKEEIEGRPSKEIYPEMADAYFKDDMEVMQTGKPKKGIIEQLPSVDNTVRWLLTDKIPYRNEHDEIAGIIVFSTDITEIKNSEYKLQLQTRLAETFAKFDDKELFQNIIELVKEQFNSRFGYFGYINSKGDLVCMTMTGINQAIDQTEDKSIILPKNSWTGFWGESLKNKSNLIQNTELEMPAGHGSIKNAMAAVICYKEQLIGQITLANSADMYNNEQLRWLGEICNYIAPLLHAAIQESTYRQELIAAKEQAEESDLLKTLFLNNISHEVRTPMNGIIGFSEFLSDTEQTPENRKKYASVVIECSKQLLRTIDNILEISTLELKKEEATMASFSLNKLLDDLHSVFLLNKTNPYLEIVLDLPFDEPDSWITSDKNRLFRILNNLIENAIKYTQEGTIRIAYALNNDQLQITITDTGVGIAPEYHQSVFNRFVQENIEISKRVGGLGIGLSIAQEYASIIGGKITLESEKGKGSTFTISIPYKKAQPEEINLTHYLSNTSNHKQITILIAEDEITNYLYLEEILLNSKYSSSNIIHANDGEELLNICQKVTPDLILLDIKMPGLNGYETAKQLRKNDIQAPIIVQTAYSNPSDRETALNSGCNDFISKPINVVEFFRLIDKWINT